MKNKEKMLARKLREQGKSINTIKKQLGVSKSSISLWVRDIKLTDRQYENIDKRARPGRMRAFRHTLEANGKKAAIKRKGWFNQGYELGQTNEDFRMLCALYWCEGYKLNNKNTFSFTNCDPKLLTKILALTKKFSTKLPIIDVHAYVDNGLTLKQISNWWKRELKLKDDPRIYQVDHSKASKKKRKGMQSHGTIQIRIHSTELIQKVFGGIEYLKR